MREGRLDSVLLNFDEVRSATIWFDALFLRDGLPMDESFSYIKIGGGLLFFLPSYVHYCAG